MSWKACRWTKRGKASAAKGLRRAGQLIADQRGLGLAGGGGPRDRRAPPPGSRPPGGPTAPPSVSASRGGSIEQAWEGASVAPVATARGAGE